MAAQNVVVEKRLRDIEMSDARTFKNNTGRTLYHNEILLIPLESSQGMSVLVDAGNVGGTVAANAYFTGIVKMVVNVPCSATAFSTGQTVQLAQSAAGATCAATTAGIYAIGQCTVDVATSASYVPVDLNFGPNAFKVW
jgi:hypothetical protein